MNIAEVLRAQSITWPDATAIIDTRRGRSRILTFAQLDRATAQAATLLHQAGLRQGDGVLVLLPTSAELYIGLVAIFRLGLVAMFLDPSVGRKNIERSCELHPPKGLIASPTAHVLRVLSPALQRIPVKFSVGLPVPGARSWNSAHRVEPHEPVEYCSSETPALLTFTSGSTGQPKAAMRTHGFLLAQHRALQESLELMPGEVDLTTLPIFVLANLASGVTSLLPDADMRRPASIDPAPLLAQIQGHQPSRIVASPVLLERLADHCLQGGLSLPGFKKIFTGGAPVFPCLLEKLSTLAPQAEIVSVYGSTEAEPIAGISRRAVHPEVISAMLAGRGLIAGPPVPTIHLRILPDHWGRPIGPYTRAGFATATLHAGGVGEIVVSGEHVLPGYLNGHGDEETKFTVDGTVWHRTGDAGYLDDRGRLWLLGRCSARIQDAHGTLYPFTVECIAHHQPGVRHAAVAGHNGRRILVIEPDASGSYLDLATLRQSLAWAHIEEMQVLERIPVDRRHNGKVDYPALLELLEERAH